MAEVRITGLHKRYGAFHAVRGIDLDIRDGEFTVLQGSHARQSWVSTPHAYKALHEALVRDRVLVPDPPAGLLRFARDYVFASPSAAAAATTSKRGPMAGSTTNRTCEIARR